MNIYLIIIISGFIATHNSRHIGDLHLIVVITFLVTMIFQIIPVTLSPFVSGLLVVSPFSTGFLRTMTAH